MTIQFFHQPKDRLRMTVDDEKSYVTVKPVWAAPLSHPERYLALLDGKDNEILTLRDPKEELSADSYEAVMAEVKKRYLTATIHKIDRAKVEFGATYWQVETERGPRDFVTQNLQENAQWLSDHHLLLIDVDGNRFEIPDTAQLDEASYRQLFSVV